MVVHDDLELEPFRVQLKVGGGHGGHNGLKSVNAHVGSPDYARVRVGVGRPPARWIRPTTCSAASPAPTTPSWRPAWSGPPRPPGSAVELGASKAMNQVNRRREPA